MDNRITHFRHSTLDTRHSSIIHRRCVALALALLALAPACLTGCRSHPGHNSSFPLSFDEAKQHCRQMQDGPKRLERPLVVLGGWLDPFIVASHLVDQFKSVTGDDRIIGVSFAFCGTFEECRRYLMKRVVEAFGDGDGHWTEPVDVVAFSMGGLVARLAAAPPDESAESSRRLRIVRLFTISTPHQGARLAGLPTFNRHQIDMRAGSGFLERLDTSLEDAEYDLFTYVRLGDSIVGEANAAPEGRTAWWVSKRPMDRGHGGAYRDPRILADIARILRGEDRYTTEPPAELPEEKGTKARRGKRRSYGATKGSGSDCFLVREVNEVTRNSARGRSQQKPCNRLLRIRSRHPFVAPSLSPYDAATVASGRCSRCGSFSSEGYATRP